MKSKHIPPPPGQLDQNDMYSNKRWRQVQRLANSFWTKWETQYLHNLQGRQKWHKQQSNIHKETHKTRDDLIHMVKVQLATTELNSKGVRLAPPTYLDRPIHKLIYLFTP
ncbi:hypothetical protein EB796_004368 [Bugula neritina]|uniref:DUF5641 domain-containing protein n=1 Tax=Bugula neritina TaxID=10212 RepID=A0A7J7KGG6_BUGNE|nr:hypothetical protein EB796_004368 [Bugula neritina]